MTPQVLAIIHVIFPPEEKARAFALFGAVASLGAVTGPILGGAIIAADLRGSGWRMIFLINAPLGVLALVAGLRILPSLPSLPSLPPDRRMSGDPVGIALFVAAVVLLVLPLIEGRALGWPWWSFALMAAALVLAAAFRRWQMRQAGLGRAELLPAALLANREFLLGLLLVTLFFSGIPGLFLILAIFLQSGFGLTALASGLVTVPFPFGVMSASTISARFGARPGRRSTPGASCRRSASPASAWASPSARSSCRCWRRSPRATPGADRARSRPRNSSAPPSGSRSPARYSSPPLGPRAFAEAAATRPGFVRAAATASLYQIAVFAAIVAISSRRRAPATPVAIPPIE